MIHAMNCAFRQMETSSHKVDLVPANEAPYLVATKGGCNCEQSSYPTFISISHGNVYHCNIPSLNGEKLFVGCHHGWIALVDQFCEPSILDPVTGQEIPLPSITTLPFIYPSYNSNGSLNCYYVYDCFHKKFFNWTPKHLRKSVTFNRIVFSSNPARSTNFIVVAIYGLGLDLIFTKPNIENKWNLLGCKECFVDLIFHDEKTIFALTYVGALHLITFGEENITNERICEPLAQASHGENRYLVDGGAYGILQVVRELKDIDRPTTDDMTVLRFVDDGQRNKKWVVTKTLDGQAIFIGAGATVLLPIDKVCGGIKPNNVYFTDDWWDILKGCRKLDRDIGRYSLEDEELEFFSRGTYHSTWPPPIWMY